MVLLNIPCIIQFWTYLLIVLITSLIGAIGAILLNKESTCAAFGCLDRKNSPERHNNPTDFPKEWFKKLALAFIASASTPLVLFLTDKMEVMCPDNIDNGYLLVYIGYSLILATFGEAVIVKLGELLSTIKDSINRLLGNK